MKASRLTLIAISCALVSPAVADTVELLGGGHLTGQVVRRGKSVFVAVDDEIQVAIEDSRVLRVVESDSLKEYQKNAAAVGDDADMHYQLARWCAVPGNVPGFSKFYTRFHMQRAVELSPNHEEARAYLGYKRDGAKWVRTTDLFRSRGMIRKGRKWEMPEAVALNEQSDDYEVSAKVWIRDLKRLIKVIRKGDTPGNKKYAEAVGELRGINDPVASTAVAQELNHLRSVNASSGLRSLRRELLKLLIRFGDSVSIQTMVEMGIEEPDPALREQALDALVDNGAGSAIATYMKILRTPRTSNDLINRAARALQWFPREELAMDYINALVTQHTEAVAAGPEMQVGFGDNGGGGMQTGRKPPPKPVARTNPAVLALVKKVVTDVDFGYDEKRWRAYLAAKKTAYSGDLRRDP